MAVGDVDVNRQPEPAPCAPRLAMNNMSSIAVNDMSLGPNFKVLPSTDPVRELQTIIRDR